MDERKLEPLPKDEFLDPKLDGYSVVAVNSTGTKMQLRAADKDRLEREGDARLKSEVQTKDLHVVVAGEDVLIVGKVM